MLGYRLEGAWRRPCLVAMHPAAYISHPMHPQHHTHQAGTKSIERRHPTKHGTDSRRSRGHGAEAAAHAIPLGV